ncbi:MAG TPA: hypothetical protein VJ817_08885, partial [Gemmatimonadales bacterium]|nr:hypothetical protein [Gemmatimonadales bacterium]
MNAFHFSAAFAASFLAAGTPPQSPLDGRWRAVLDLAGGALPFELAVSRENNRLVAAICNGPKCADHAVVTQRGDSVVFDIADYGATIVARRRGDSLTGTYRNVGRNGPRSIPFRASAGSWPRAVPPAALLGSW